MSVNSLNSCRSVTLYPVRLWKKCIFNKAFLKRRGITRE